MRRLRSLRFGGCRQPRLPRPLRPPAPGPGVGRHRLARRRAGSTSSGRWATSPTSSTRRASRACRAARPSGTSGTRRPGPRSWPTPSPSSSRPGAGRSALAHNGNLVNAREIRAVARGQGSPLHDDLRLRGDPPPDRAVQGADARGRHRRGPSRGARGVLDRHPVAGGDLRGARSATASARSRSDGGRARPSSPPRPAPST